MNERPLDQLIRGWPCDHITYDPKMRKGDYSIIRGSTHDGTLLFTRSRIHAIGSIRCRSKFLIWGLLIDAELRARETRSSARS